MHYIGYLVKYSKWLECSSILKLATPIIGVRFLHILTSFIGILFISHLGPLEIAASTLVTVLSTTITVIAMSPFIAIGIMASRYFGEKHYDKIGEVLSQSWLLAIIISVIVFLILENLPDLLVFLKQPNELMPDIGGGVHLNFPIKELSRYCI